MTFCRNEFSMYTFMREINKEGLALFPLIHPVYCIRGKEICCITSGGLFYLLTIDIENRIIIHSLATKAKPVVEARLRHVTRISHMPLAKKRGLVPVCL